jgi:hypothetical protein
LAYERSADLSLPARFSGQVPFVGPPNEFLHNRDERIHRTEVFVFDACAESILINGEAGIRTRDTSFSSYNGLANRTCQDASTDQSVTSKDAIYSLSLDLSLNVTNHPELAELIRAWPGLPEALRAGIAVMVKSTQSTQG